MLPIIPQEAIVSSLELACYGCTVVAACLTYLITLRF